MADQGIYREAALARLASPEGHDHAVRIVGRATWIVLGALAVLVVGGLIWSAVLMIPITVPGQGILLAPGGVLDVSSDSPGRLVSFTIHLGDTVDKGEVVGQLDQPTLRQDLAAAQGELRDAQSEHDQIVDFQQHRATILAASIAQRRQAFQDDILSLSEQLTWLNQKAQADQELAARNLITSEKVLETRIDIAKTTEEKEQAQNGLRNLDVEASKAEVDDQRERLASELKIGAAQRKIQSLQDRLERESVVVSPYSGRVVELKVNPGELVERDGALFSLEPLDQASAPATEKASTGPLSAVIFVPPNDGKKIRPGMLARVSPSTVRREEYGFIEGRVKRVAEVPSTPEGMNRILKNREMVQTLVKEGAPFEVEIDLLADPNTPSGYKWSSAPGPTVKVDAGTLATADVETRSQPLLGLVVPSLRQVVGGSP